MAIAVRSLAVSALARASPPRFAIIERYFETAGLPMFLDYTILAGNGYVFLSLTQISLDTIPGKVRLSRPLKLARDPQGTLRPYFRKKE